MAGEVLVLGSKFLAFINLWTTVNARRIVGTRIQIFSLYKSVDHSEWQEKCWYKDNLSQTGAFIKSCAYHTKAM